MQAFHYKGYDLSGNPVTGEITAASADDVERRMANQQVTLVLVKPAKAGRQATNASGAPASKAGPRRRISDAEGAAVLSNLSVMVGAGVPFIEALEAIESIAPREAIVKGVQGLRSQIVGGQSLASAIRQADTLFPEVVADMIRVAEEGGSLSMALASAATYLGRAADLRRKVMNAMLYPAVMLFVSFATVLVLIVFVMPRFADIFVKMHAEIPITTRLMMNAGDLIRSKPWVCLGGAVASAVGLRWAFRNPWFSSKMALIAFKLPGIGDLLNKLALSRALQAISTLVSGNVPIVQALEHGSKVAGSRSLSDAIGRSVKMVSEGSTMFDAFKEHRVFPPVVTQMIGVGERTGKLGAMIASCAEQMEIEADGRLKSLVSVLEPLMIVGMGLLVGTITVSIITPIYSAIQHVK